MSIRAVFANDTSFLKQTVLNQITKAKQSFELSKIIQSIFNFEELKELCKNKVKELNEVETRSTYFKLESINDILPQSLIVEFCTYLHSSEYGIMAVLSKQFKQIMLSPMLYKHYQVFIGTTKLTTERSFDIDNECGEIVLNHCERRHMNDIDLDHYMITRDDITIPLTQIINLEMKSPLRINGANYNKLLSLIKLSQIKFLSLKFRRKTFKESTILKFDNLKGIESDKCKVSVFDKVLTHYTNGNFHKLLCLNTELEFDCDKDYILFPQIIKKLSNLKFCDLKCYFNFELEIGDRVEIKFNKNLVGIQLSHNKYNNNITYNFDSCNELLYLQIYNLSYKNLKLKYLLHLSLKLHYKDTLEHKWMTHIKSKNFKFYKLLIHFNIWGKIQFSDDLLSDYNIDTFNNSINYISKNKKNIICFGRYNTFNNLLHSLINIKYNKSMANKLYSNYKTLFQYCRFQTNLLAIE